MTYPPTERSTTAMVVCILFGLAAIAGIAYPGAWQQRVGCLVVAAISLGMAYLEWRKPPKGKARPERQKGGKRRAGR